MRAALDDFAITTQGQIGARHLSAGAAGRAN